MSGKRKTKRDRRLSAPAIGGLAVGVLRAVIGGRRNNHRAGQGADGHHQAGREQPQRASQPSNHAEGDGPSTNKSPGGGLKTTLAKMDGVQRRRSWLGFPLATAKKFGEDQAGNLAALISYYSFFSLFPLLLALVTILGFVLRDDAELQRKIVDSALVQFPVIGDQIRDNIGSLDGNWIALLIGLAGALWAGMGA
ncbi:MAG: YihY/virulence factor BrkB family protein, partial [Actinomycetota bacterium]|nr:YihY/virulence factor BrkB family protein [Actinomycetota bacterium]